MGEYTKTDHDDAGTALSRRTLLGSAGVLAGSTGLAGCIGGDGGDGGNGGDGSGGGDGPVTCADLTSEYTLYDSGENAFVFDVELPAVVIDNAEFEETAGVWELDANREWANGDTLEITVQQAPNGSEEERFESASDFGGQEVEQSGTLSFNGEDRPVWRPPPSKGSGAARTVELPYEVDGTRLYFKIDTIADSGLAESTDECVTAFDEVAEHMVMSLTPNEDSMIGSEMES
jgi:hypothetical protein